MAKDYLYEPKDIPIQFWGFLMMMMIAQEKPQKPYSAY